MRDEEHSAIDLKSGAESIVRNVRARAGGYWSWDVPLLRCYALPPVATRVPTFIGEAA